MEKTVFNVNFFFSSGFQVSLKILTSVVGYKGDNLFKVVIVLWFGCVNNVWP